MLSLANVRALYEARCSKFGRQQQALSQRADRLANARLASFFLAFIFLILGGTTRPISPLLLSVSALLAVGFLIFLVLHQQALRSLKQVQGLYELNTQALARLDRNWQGIPVPEVSDFSRKFSFAKDLDLFGRASLFQLACTANTVQGRSTLERWFVTPAIPSIIQARQQAVAELAPQLESRQEMSLAGMPLTGKTVGVERFLNWAEGEPWLPKRPWLVWFALGSAVVTLSLVGLQLAGILPPLWVAPLLVNIVVTYVFTRDIHGLFASVSNRQGAIGQYAELLTIVSDLPVSSPELQRLQQAIKVDDLAAPAQLKRLDSLVGLADLRHSPFFYLPIQFLTLWDVPVLFLLERWQKRVGSRVRVWLDALGEIEALASLASLAHDNPDWTFPVIETGPLKRIDAYSLAHPLISPSRRVANDVSIGPQGTFLLVTGSNMSGKSTLLRSIGINVVLAQAGGPVCAQRFSLPPLTVETSMRVQDSLEDGVSFFMAELKRLKQVVEATGATERTLLYLLDEILQGTNSSERQVAVRRVVAHLLKQGALGAISTHDLALADIKELSEASQPVHFRESIESDETGPVMTFDYKMRPGIATTTNALQLLEIVGLKLD